MKKLIISILFGISIPAYALQQDIIEIIQKGEYIARSADCSACHTIEGEKPYSGGLPIESPFGVIYSTNITPDKDVGIGNYTEEEFSQAVRHGRRKDGKFLYPAMPYPSYVKMTDDDIHALYIYFQKGIKPVNQKPPETNLTFPFNQRWAIRFWNMMFTDSGIFVPDNNLSDMVNRGAYLVQGAGHCGSCHTPRAFTQQEKAYDSHSEKYLSGTELNGWPVPSLRAGGDNHGGITKWSIQDIADYLQTGRNSYASVGGEMTSVIKNSMIYLSDKDIQAIAVYLKSLNSTSNKLEDYQEKARQDTENTLTETKDLTQGQKLYLDNCSGCHFVSGKGAPPVFPPLAGNFLVNSDNPTGLILTILDGATLPSTPRAPTQLVMPDFRWRLSDQQVADLATFIRGGWGNHQKPVTADEVKKIRAQNPDKKSVRPENIE